MTAPLISIVIAAYNAEKYLGEALESIRLQTFRDYEIVLVDDGSTDSTALIAHGCENLTVLSQSNRGAAAARNAGIQAARGKYVAFLDADDLWLPSKLEKQAAQLLAHPRIAWIYSDAIVFDSATRRSVCRIGERIDLCEGDILRPLLLRCFIPSATPVIRKTALLQAGLFDEARERRIGEDWSLWLRLAERHPAALIDEPLAMIRAHACNTSRVVDTFEAYRSKRAILAQAIKRNPRAATGIRFRAHAGIAISAGLRCLRHVAGSRRQEGAR